MPKTEQPAVVYWYPRPVVAVFTAVVYWYSRRAAFAAFPLFGRPLRRNNSHDPARS